LNLYVLDTDTCSYIIRKNPAQVLSAMQEKSERGDYITISSITYAELLLGAERSNARKKHLTLITSFTECLDEILPWDGSAAESFSKLQAALYKKGTPIGPNDTMIAGHVLSVSATIVTNNTKHFKQVPKLKIENRTAQTEALV